MGGGAVCRRGGFAAWLLLALAVSGLAPDVAHAAGGGAEILPGDPHGAVVADLTLDGAADLIRVQAADARRHVVDVWSHGAGGWRRIGSAPIPPLDPSDADDQPLPGASASALLVWHVGGEARVLVLARWGARADDPSGFPCCLSMFEVVVRDGDIELEPIAADGGVAELVHVVDFDGDGTDELVRTETNSTGDTGTMEVLRWDGSAFRSLLVQQNADWMWGLWVGDTDGRDGADLLLGPTPEGTLRRMAWVDGQLATEEAHLDPSERNEGWWIAGIADGALVLTGPHELRVVRWPRGEQFSTTALRGVTFPFGGVIGAGAESLLAVAESIDVPGDAFTPLTIYDLGLERVGQIEPEPSAARLAVAINAQARAGRPLERYLGPYAGPMPSARGEAARRFAWGGHLIEAGPDGGYETQPIGPMAGMYPVGFAGPGDGWLVLSAWFLGGDNVAYLYPGAISPGMGRTSVVSMDDALDADRQAVTVELRGAAVVGEPVDGVTELFAGTDGFEVAVTAPAGSWVQAASNGGRLQQSTVEAEPIVLTVAPGRARRDEDSSIEATLIVATPDGHATLIEWNGRFGAEPPDLDVAGATDGLSFRATVQGVAGPHASVTIDGRPADVDRSGAFTATVDAWPWPRRVEVVARDPIGNEVVQRIEVIGLVDYRGLPWPLIGGLSAVGAGAALFVRTPRLRSRPAQSFGDGRLEELDPIDGSGFDAR